MKKNLLLLLGLLFAATSYTQVSYLHYRHVPVEHIDTFIERETKHWSKVAKAAIDNGQLAGWTLWRKVGVTEEDAPNFVFVNSYDSMDQLDGDVWGSNLEALGDVKPEDVGTMSISKLTFDYYIKVEEFIPGDYKYAIVNYAKPKDLAGFIAENRKLWKPFHERNIEGGGAMTAWGMASVIYPQGNLDRFTVMTWDGFNKLSHAMNYLSGPDGDGGDGGYFSDIISESKMNEFMPDGFQYRIIYERVMTVSKEE
jgi:hypothetical protein